MECTEVFVGNMFSRESKTLEQFREYVEEKGWEHSWSNLVFALAEENTWSKEYSFSARILEEGCSLLINYPDTLEPINRPLTFKQEHDVSVSGVKDAVRDRLWEFCKEFASGISRLQKNVNDLTDAIGLLS